ncbi:MAG TPA: DUF4167 domain-containing protein [Methyloceanibacter sp.]|nr:DUF4167 domain-containing protein [Methyloceanibacter sp.]
MRQGQQQNRRGRGRSGGGRKPQNPLARNYESNGPDVKIRGTASHVAEKYMSLARDALASGDMIAAESYLQHAEHYNRIVMAAQTQLSPQGGAQPAENPNGGAGGQQPQSRWHSDSEEEGSDEAASVASGQTGGGGQDRERHTGDREHQGGGRDRGRRAQGGNGSRDGVRDAEGVRDANGAEPAEPAQAAGESENAPDTVS